MSAQYLLCGQQIGFLLVPDCCVLNLACTKQLPLQATVDFTISPGHTLRWCIPKELRCLKLACDVLRKKIQHAQHFATDFGIYQLIAIQFSYGLHHCDGDSISFHVIWDTKFSVEYFYLTSQQ